MRKVELPLAKGFLSPANGGNEGGVKTIERRDSYVNLGEIRARSKNFPQKFGSFTENPYICTMNREMEYKLH